MINDLIKLVRLGKIKVKSTLEITKNTDFSQLNLEPKIEDLDSLANFLIESETEEKQQQEKKIKTLVKEIIKQKKQVTTGNTTGNEVEDLFYLLIQYQELGGNREDLK